LSDDFPNPRGPTHGNKKITGLTVLVVQCVVRSHKAKSKKVFSSVKLYSQKAVRVHRNTEVDREFDGCEIRLSGVPLHKHPQIQCLEEAFQALKLYQAFRPLV